MNTDKIDNGMLFEFLEDLKKSIDSKKAVEIDTQKIDSLVKQLQTNARMNGQYVQQLEEITDKVNSISNEVKLPIIKEHHFSFNIESKVAYFMCISSWIISIVLCVILGFSEQSNAKQENNDLKYRYIKMKGSASPEMIEYLETIFDIKRDSPTIEQIRNDVANYEKLIQEQAQAVEQAHLNNSEAIKLHEKTESIKNKQ
jgi:hypothetical protein